MCSQPILETEQNLPGLEQLEGNFSPTYYTACIRQVLHDTQNASSTLMKSHDRIAFKKNKKVYNLCYSPKVTVIEVKKKQA